MSTIRDFENRDRSDTAATAGSRIAPLSLSPQATNFREMDRRGSTVSRSSRLSPHAGSLRHRHPSRSNTVTTYHEPEPHDMGWLPGAEPGIDPLADDDDLPAHIALLKTRSDINIIDYCPDPDIPPNHMQATNETLEAVLDKARPDDFCCRWISVNGMSWDVVKILGKNYNLHRLAIEDIVYTHTRTKVDWYADHACAILTLQKLVRLHQHEGNDSKCDCLDPVSSEDSFDEKHEPSKHSRDLWWWQRMNAKRRKRRSPFPTSLDKNDDGRIDEYVNAHSGLSEDSPIRPVRTLHRYESSKIPEHTAFMEKHSTLAGEELAVSVEQVSIFLLSDNTVISFFEQSAEDVEHPILSRIYSTETMLRRSSDASLLLQAIIDAIVDLAVPVRDAYNKARKELQVDAMVSPNIATSRALHIFGEEIDMLQNLIKPIVHLVNAIRDHNAADGPMPALTSSPPPPPAEGPPPAGRTTNLANDIPPPLPTPPIARPGHAQQSRDGAPVYNRKLSAYRRAPALLRNQTASVAATSVSITPLAHTYFGDVLDHCITMIQALEQMDASASNISTLIFNTVGARTNNFMMILAIVTVLFAPLTFISGYFGQNFSSGHGLDHPFSFFWVVSVPVLAVFCVLVFGMMLSDNIKAFMSKRGMKRRRNQRDKIRRQNTARRA